MKIIPTYCCGQWRNGRCDPCPMMIRREEAISRVQGNTDPAWRDEAFLSADRVMSRMESFTTDDIWIDLDRRHVPSPHEPRAMGPIMRILTNNEEIKFSGRYTQSRIPRGHGRTVKIYNTLV